MVGFQTNNQYPQSKNARHHRSEGGEGAHRRGTRVGGVVLRWQLNTCSSYQTTDDGAASADLLAGITIPVHSDRLSSQQDRIRPLHFHHLSAASFSKRWQGMCQDDSRDQRFWTGSRRLKMLQRWRTNLGLWE